MMHKKLVILTILVFVTLIIIIGGLYFVLNKNNHENSSEPITYVLKQHKNTIAVFIEGQNEPHITFDVAFNSLPFKDKELLIKGIYSRNLSEIMKHVEDYDG